MWKSYFLTYLCFNIINEFEKIFIYSPYLHQNFFQKFFKCFKNSIPININPNVLNEEDKALVINEILNDKHFKKSDTVIETYESIDELNFPQENSDA